MWGSGWGRYITSPIHAHPVQRALNLKHGAVVILGQQRPDLTRTVWGGILSTRLDRGKLGARSDTLARQLVDDAAISSEVPKLVAALAPRRAYVGRVPNKSRYYLNSDPDSQ